MRWGAAVLIALGVMSAAACAGPPSNGPVQTTKLGQSDNAVFISSVEPAKGMDPKAVVTNFLQAMTGDDRDPTFHVAQEYLTGDAAKTWIKPGRRTWTGGTHIVQSTNGTPDVTPSIPVPDNMPVNTVVEVEVRDKLVGALDSLGFYSANKYPGADDHYQFLVKKTADGVWQITNPPDFRMLTQLSFRRAYPNPLPVYLPTDPSSWVPGKVDQVYLTQTGYISYTYDALAEAAITGRVDQSPSEDPLASRINVDPAGNAEVELKRAPADYSATRKAIERTFSAAAVLPQLVSAAPQLKTFTVKFPGCSPAVCDSSQVFQLSVPAPQPYWVCYQDEKPQIVYKQPSVAACPVPDPKQVVDVHYDQLVPNTPIAVKQLPNVAVTGRSNTGPFAVVAAVVPNGTGANVVVQSERSATGAGVIWYVADGRSTVTDLAWDPDGSLWVVDNSKLYRVPDPNLPGGKKMEKISAPGWDSVARFKPSPDGSRDVLVAKAGSRLAAAVVDVEPSEDNMLRLTTLTPLLSDQQVVTDAAWADGRTVVLLAANASSSAQQSPSRKLFKVYADSSQEAIVDDGDAQPAADRFGAAYIDTSNTLWVISNVPGDKPSKSTVTIRSRPGLDETESGDMPVLAIHSSS